MKSEFTGIAIQVLIQLLGNWCQIVLQFCLHYEGSSCGYKLVMFLEFHFVLGFITMITLVSYLFVRHYSYSWCSLLHCIVL